MTFDTVMEHVEQAAFNHMAHHPHPKGGTQTLINEHLPKKVKPNVKFAHSQTINVHKKDSIIKSPAFGQSYSDFQLTYKGSKLDRYAKGMSEPWTINVTWTDADNCVIGKQSAKHVGSCFLGGSTSAALTTDTAFTHLGTALNAASALANITAVPTTNKQSMKALLDKFTSKTTYFNKNANADQNLTIYNVIARNTNYLAAAGVATDPLTSWTTALTDEGNVASYLNMNQLPTMGKNFNMNWKVLKKTNVELAAGRQHVHEFTFKPKMLIDTEYFSKYQNIKGITCFEFVIHWGAPVVDSSAPTLITTSASQLAWITVQTTVLREVAIQPRIQTFATNVATTIAGTTDTVNEATGKGEAFAPLG